MTSGTAPLAGRVAIVTGSSRGIGKDIAHALAAAGAAVVVGARSEEPRPDPRLPGTVHEVAGAIEQSGGRALARRLEMRDPASIEDCVSATVEHFGRIDIVVNNAAAFVGNLLERIEPRHVDVMTQVNIRGPLAMVRAALPHLRTAAEREGSAHVINISSRAARFPGAGPYAARADARSAAAPLYGTTKAALERLTQELAMELEPDRIAVNALSPQGGINTPGVLFGQSDPENPRLDFEIAEKMAKAALWIVRQPPSWTGHIVYDEELCAEQGL